MSYKRSINSIEEADAITRKLHKTVFDNWEDKLKADEEIAAITQKHKTVFDSFEEKYNEFNDRSQGIETRTAAAYIANHVGMLADSRFSVNLSHEMTHQISTNDITALRKAHRPNALNVSPIIGQVAMTALAVAAGVVPCAGQALGYTMSTAVTTACNAVSQGAQSGTNVMGSLGGVTTTLQSGKQAIIQTQIQQDQNARSDMDHSRQLAQQSAERIEETRRKEEDNKSKTMQIMVQ